MKLSIIIPARNEGKFIKRCLESIVQSATAAGLNNVEYEVILVDGASDDDTMSVAKSALMELIVIENPRQILASGWNLGARLAQGEYVLAMNAHAELSVCYIRDCLQFLDNGASTIAGVGGALRTLAIDDSVQMRVVSGVLSSLIGVGSSRFRTAGVLKEAEIVDSVHCPMYRKEIFEQVEFDERLVRSQDYKFHMDLKGLGYDLILLPEIYANYYPKTRPRHYLQWAFNNGVWLSYPSKYVGLVGSLRHYIPMMFVLGLISILIGSLVYDSHLLWLAICYGFIIFAGAAQLFWREGVIGVGIGVCVIACQHLGYGAGTVFGFLKAGLERND